MRPRSRAVSLDIASGNHLRKGQHPGESPRNSDQRPRRSQRLRRCSGVCRGDASGERERRSRLDEVLRQGCRSWRLKTPATTPANRNRRPAGGGGSNSARAPAPPPARAHQRGPGARGRTEIAQQRPASVHVLPRSSGQQHGRIPQRRQRGLGRVDSDDSRERQREADEGGDRQRRAERIQDRVRPAGESTQTLTAHGSTRKIAAWY